MTSSSDMDQHPDVEEISDLSEGLLPSSRTAALRQHLDGCALCADVHRSLMEIQDLLGTLPGPSRMPTDVAERIDAALAAEALLDATVGPAEDQVRIPGPAAARCDARSRSGEEAAAAVQDDAPAASDDATTGTTSSPDGTHVSRETSRSFGPLRGEDRAGTGPGRTTSPGLGPVGPGRGRTARRRRGTVVLGTAFGVAVLGLGVFLLQGTDTKRGTVADQSPSARVTAATSDADEFSGTELETRVDTLLGTKPGTEPGTEPGTQPGTSPHSNPDLRSTSTASATASNEPLMESVPQVPACVRQGTGRTEAVLATQQGTYRGSPAYLLVLANPSDETKVRVYVIDATCVGATPPVKGKILQTELYSRR